MDVELTLEHQRAALDRIAPVLFAAVDDTNQPDQPASLFVVTELEELITYALSDHDRLAAVIERLTFFVSGLVVGITLQADGTPADGATQRAWIEDVLTRARAILDAP